MVYQVSVILTEITRVVMIFGMDAAVTRQSIVLASFVPTIGPFTKTGENLEERRNGDMTENVAKTVPYLTVHQHNVILTGKIHVVQKPGMGRYAATRHLSVLVMNVWTIGLYTKTGENQKANRNGDMTENAAKTVPYLTVHQLSATLTETLHVVIVGKEGNVEKQKKCAVVRSASIIEW